MGTVFSYMILVFGLGLIVFGLVLWIGKKTSMTYDFNWRKVKEEDVKKFTAAYGITYSLLGFFMTLMALSRIFLEGKYKEVVFVLYFVTYFMFMFMIRRIKAKFGTK